MREIKFRGLTIKGDMVYGSLSLPKNKINSATPAGSYISNDYGMPFAYEIRPETVGEYVGLKDMTEKEIYEGDVVVIAGRPGDAEEDELYEVVIKDIRTRPEEFFGSSFRWSEVIGNIHENPELL